MTKANAVLDIHKRNPLQPLPNLITSSKTLHQARFDNEHAGTFIRIFGAVMPSLADSRRQVKESMEVEMDHDAILANLQDEIDQHNAIQNDLRDSLRKSKSSHNRHHSSKDGRTKFRFKSGVEDATKRRRHHQRSKHDEDDEKQQRRKRRKHDYPTTPPKEETDQEEDAATHPFPREPANPLEASQDAFRASLFDALADDEGAAAYWESVYNQPIHIYPRATTVNEQGELEQMSEAEYVEYVKQKMWERKNPEIVQERKQKERERKLGEEEKTRRRDEFVRRKEQAAWERSQRPRRDRDMGLVTSEPISLNGPQQQEYTSAWADYLAAWDELKHDLLAQRSASEDEIKTTIDPSKRIPWPVLPSQTPIKANIQDFMRHVPSSSLLGGESGAGKSRLQILKAERVRWHPDKVQQRFGGAVEEGTMKLVTGVFQVVDSLVEEERKRSGG